MAAPKSRPTPQWLTLSNGLTSMRLVAAPFFYWLIVHQSWWVACLLFWLAVASDFVDGRLARSRGESSALGGLLDHASDATFVTLGQLALAAAGWVPLLLPILIVGAFLQYVFDSRIVVGRELRASFLGRWNGIFYFVPPGVIVTREALGLTIPPNGIVLFLGWALVVSTMISMGDRLVSLVSSVRENLTGDQP
jgi:phosphatidylglycerophosphate synthase